MGEKYRNCYIERKNITKLKARKESEKKEYMRRKTSWKRKTGTKTKTNTKTRRRKKKKKRY